MGYVVVFEFPMRTSGSPDTPKVFGPFANRITAQEWLERISLKMNPNSFARATVQPMERIW